MALILQRRKTNARMQCFQVPSKSVLILVAFRAPPFIPALVSCTRLNNAGLNIHQQKPGDKDVSLQHFTKQSNADISNRRRDMKRKDSKFEMVLGVKNLHVFINY